jgi:hypothetical protein
MDKPNPKTRRCLKCGKEFESGWNGHRICDCCKFKQPSVNRQVWARRDDYMPEENFEVVVRI